MFVKKLMSNILLDTNFLIYSIDQDSKYFNATQKILSDSELHFFTSSKNLSEFLSVITRLQQSVLSITEAMKVIQEFRSSFSIIYPTEKSLLIFMDLLKKYEPSGLKIHDFEIVSIGLANNISTIATFNKKDFESISEIELINTSLL